MISHSGRINWFWITNGFENELVSEQPNFPYLIVFASSDPGEFEFLPDSFALPKERGKLYQVRKITIESQLKILHYFVNQWDFEHLHHFQSRVQSKIEWLCILSINHGNCKIEREIISSLFGGYIFSAPIEALYIAMCHHRFPARQVFTQPYAKVSQLLL